mmetsp:Transcript_2744/g.6530  ORF Transcript_2744/g.6530 Transcript_2744/m.6530 type:complete len:114 (+) Transcript_2744:130-471(+)
MQSSSGYHASSGTNSTANTRHHHHRHVQTQLSVANTQERLEQLFDEQDHKRCSEGNRKALLAENLDQLRGLTKVLEADDWKYQSNSNGSVGLTWSSAAAAPMQSSSANNVGNT